MKFKAFNQIKTLIVITLCTISSMSAAAAGNMETITKLNAAAERLNETVQNVLALNDESIQYKFVQAMQQNPDKEVITAAGESIKYPASLKKDFDAAAVEVIKHAQTLLDDTRGDSVSTNCVTKLEALRPGFNKIKAVIEQSSRYGVGEADSRAKAFFALNNSMQLSMTTAKITMARMSACGAF